MKNEAHYQKVKSEEESEEESEEDEEKLEWTTRQKLLLITVSFLNCIAFGTITLIMPYFPIVGVKMGLNNTLIGVLFGAFPLIGVIMNPLTGILLAYVNIKLIIVGGLLLAATSQVLFGFGIYLQSEIAFLLWCLIFRILTSLGLRPCIVGGPAILAQEFPSSYATVLGISELFSGLGDAGLPSLSGAIYQFGGFVWPTVVSGILLLLGVFLVLGSMRTFQLKGTTRSTGLLQSIAQLLKNPKVLVSAQSTFITSLSISVLEPIYAIFAKRVLHLNTTEIGVLYLPVWISFLVASVIVGRVVDKTGKYLEVLIMSFLLSAIGFQLIGPAPFLEGILPVGSIWLTAVGETCVGGGIGLGLIPPLPYMLKSVRDAGEADDSVNSLLSGLFTFSISCGVFLGPTLSGIIGDFVSIRMDYAIFGFVAGTEALFLILFALFNCTSRQPVKEYD